MTVPLFLAIFFPLIFVAAYSQEEPTEQPAPLNSKVQWTDLKPNKISSSFLSREKSSQDKAKRQATSITAAGDASLLFANRRYLAVISLNGSVLSAIDLGIGANAIGVDFDIRRNYIFFSDVSQRFIARFYNKQNGLILTSKALTTPDGIAWDWINEKIYWTDADEKEIEVLDPASGLRAVLVDTGASSIPRAIVLDPTTRTMFWTDWGSSPRIESASMSGNGRCLLHSTNLVWPNGLTIDYDTQNIYWVDGSRLETSKSNGSQRRLLTTIGLPHPFGITVCAGMLYWTDRSYNAVLQAPIAAPSNVSFLLRYLANNPMAIQCVSARRQPLVSNPCRNNNRGCSHLCLLSSTSPTNYTCSCPAGLMLGSNQLNCTDATCRLPCQNGGTCVRGICVCTQQWTGSQCSQPLCFTPTGCLNGGVCTIPNNCTCSSQWTGANCLTPVCSPACVNGYCILPNVCNCFTGWSGASCNNAICNPPCQNGGLCTSPGSPGLCRCLPAQSGRQCQN